MRQGSSFGMSGSLGSVRYAGERLGYLPGPPFGEGGEIGSETRRAIDDEVRRIVGEQYARAEALVAAHSLVLRRLAARLLERESLDGSAVAEALSAETAHEAVVPLPATAAMRSSPA
jgi:cell division protease FtsH